GAVDAAGSETQARRLATAGIARLLTLLKSAAVVHAAVRARQAQYGAVITLVDRLVTAAAALELLSTTPLRADERERLARGATDCASLRRVLDETGVAAGAPPLRGLPPLAGGGAARLPAIIELEHAADLLHQALGPNVAERDASSGSERGGLFVA